MIARVWFGRTRAEDARAYADYLAATGLPGLASTPGNRGVMLLRRVGSDEATFGVISLWESMDAVVGFAGDDVGAAVYYPEDERFLLDRAPTVDHYEIVGGAGRPDLAVTPADR